MWIAAFAPFLWVEPRNVLPSMATTSADTPISLATQAMKATLEFRGVERRENVAEVVV